MVLDLNGQVIDAANAAAIRPLAPQVDLLELVRETRVVEQELACQLLEERALLALALRARTVLIQQRVQGGLRRDRPRVCGISRRTIDRRWGSGIRGLHSGESREVFGARSSHATKNSG